MLYTFFFRPCVEEKYQSPIFFPNTYLYWTNGIEKKKGEMKMGHGHILKTLLPNSLCLPGTYVYVWWNFFISFFLPQSWKIRKSFSLHMNRLIFRYVKFFRTLRFFSIVYLNSFHSHFGLFVVLKGYFGDVFHLGEETDHKVGKFFSRSCRWGGCFSMEIVFGCVVKRHQAHDTR